MIVEGYSADVYCECEDHSFWDLGTASRPHMLTGPNKRTTDRERRKAGWIRVNGCDVCPRCKTRKPLRVSEFYSRGQGQR